MRPCRFLAPAFRLLPVALAFSLACGGGSGDSGGGNPAPSPPTDLILTQGSDFDLIHLRWTPPPQAVDGYVVEDRILPGAFAQEPGVLPGDAIGVDAVLSETVPELVTIGCRMRSVKGATYSAYTPEATIFRGLRPPSGLSARTQTEDIQLAWTQGSQVAADLVVERATWDGTLGTFGAYAPVATLPGTATRYLDQPTDGPMVVYGYRIHYETPFNGATVRSMDVTQTADQWTALAPPDAPQATSTGSGVHLSWTITSRNLQGQVVERAVGLGAPDTAFNSLAFLGASATSFDDPVAAGPYSYRIRSTTSATGYGSAPSAPAQADVVVPPPPGPWGLQAQTLTLPLGDGLARSLDGGWHVAANWCIGPANPQGLALWRPTSTTWDMRPCGPVQGPGRFVSPGVALDAAGHPHALYLKDGGGTVTPGPMIVTHLWHDGTQWQEEVIATRTFWNGNVRYPAEYAMAPSGALHLLWMTTQVVDQVTTPRLEYATNASGSWVVGDLPLTLVTDLSRIVHFRVASAPDGTLFAALAANTNTTQGPSAGSLLLLRKPAGGSWSEELAFTDTLYLWNEVPFVLLPRDADRAAFLFVEATTYPNPNLYRFAIRTASGWGTPQTLCEEATGSGYKVPAAAQAPDGSRVAALLPTPGGTALLTWDAANGWLTAGLRPLDPFGLPWVAFDATGHLHALVPFGPAGTDGLAPWLYLTAAP